MQVADVPSARVTFPLAVSQARAYHGPRVALLGDAAHSIHPQVPAPSLSTPPDA